MRTLALLLAVAFTLRSIAQSSASGTPIWSKQGKVFSLAADNSAVGHIPPQRAYSPDLHKSLRLDFHRSSKNDEADSIPELTLVAKNLKIQVPIDPGWNQIEVLWAPNSNAFALTGGYNAYTNATRLYRISHGKLSGVPLGTLQQDMAKVFPTCKAASADPVDCKRESSGDYFNYATVAWANSITAIIMAEVPCSSSWGGIMCQVEAYQFDIANGSITARMNASEFQTQWQSSLGFQFHVPDPPEWKLPPTPGQ